MGEKSGAEDGQLTFGIYPGGVAAEGDLQARAADSPGQIKEALEQLQGGRSFLVRSYGQYVGSGTMANMTPLDPEQYADEGRKLDLVLCYRAPFYDREDWKGFIGRIIKRYGPYLAKLQVTEEANSTGPGGDGGSPGVIQALIEGVIVAKEEALRQGYSLQVGFNATPGFNPQDEFWVTIGREGGQNFLEALDYVGLDFFADVFRPIAPEKLSETIVGLLTFYRQVNMANARIPAAVPLHITENGWATGPERPYERQAVVLETVVRTIYEQREAFNITHYEHFALRDADSGKADLFYQFGLLRDDYTPKPAFEVYRKLIAEFGVKQ